MPKRITNPIGDEIGSYDAAEALGVARSWLYTKHNALLAPRVERLPSGKARYWYSKARIAALLETRARVIELGRDLGRDIEERA